MPRPLISLSRSGARAVMVAFLLQSASPCPPQGLWFEVWGQESPSCGSPSSQGFCGIHSVILFLGCHFQDDCSPSFFREI